MLQIYFQTFPSNENLLIPIDVSHRTLRMHFLKSVKRDRYQLERS